MIHKVYLYSLNYYIHFIGSVVAIGAVISGQRVGDIGHGSFLMRSMRTDPFKNLLRSTIP